MGRLNEWNIPMLERTYVGELYYLWFDQGSTNQTAVQQAASVVTS